MWGTDGWLLWASCVTCSELLVTDELAGFRAEDSVEGPQDGRGMQGQAGPGLRTTFHCLGWGCRCTVLLGAGPVGRTPARMDQEGGQRVRPWGPDPAWLFPAFRPRSSPRLPQQLQRAGPELGRPPRGGVPLRRRSAAWWKAGGGDVASAALDAGLACGRPGGVTHGRSELSGMGPSCSQSRADVPVLLQTERG